MPGSAPARVLRRRDNRIETDGGVEFLCTRGQRKFLPTWWTSRRTFIEREDGAGLLQEDRLHRLLQCRRSSCRCAKSISTTGNRLLHPVDHGGNGQALHQDRWSGPL